MVIGCTAAAAARSRSCGAVAISSRGSPRIIAFMLGPCSYKLDGDFPCRDTAGALDSPWLRDSILNPRPSRYALLKSGSFSQRRSVLWTGQMRVLMGPE